MIIMFLHNFMVIFELSLPNFVHSFRIWQYSVIWTNAQILCILVHNILFMIRLVGIIKIRKTTNNYLILLYIIRIKIPYLLDL